MHQYKSLPGEPPVDHRRAIRFIATRRRLAFWLGMCLFWFAHRVRAAVMDELAADIMDAMDPRPRTEPWLNQTRGRVAEDTERQRVDRLREKLKQAHADPDRRARDGRPPSKWLRSLNAAEIRIWLKMIDVPEFGVADMTFWTHLTRDHSFDPLLINGLTIAEQAKLHSAAHFGY